MTVSKGEVNRAGAALREWAVRGADPEDEPEPAMRVLWQFRAEHLVPMLNATRILRTAVEGSAAPQVLVSNRLKRMPQIVRKLVRMPETNLARMEDIGGCRAVLLGGPSEVLAVVEQVKSSIAVKRTRDYVTDPRATGYRGFHIVVEDEGRRVEIQIRTLGEQQWASSVERLAGRTGANLKDGVGPDEIVQYLRDASAAISAIESGSRLSPTQIQALHEARSDVLRIAGLG